MPSARIKRELCPNCGIRYTRKGDSACVECETRKYASVFEGYHVSGLPKEFEELLTMEEE